MPEYVWLIKYNWLHIIESTRYMLLHHVFSVGSINTEVGSFHFSSALFQQNRKSLIDKVQRWRRAAEW
jgi:hypothetical protein